MLLLSIKYYYHEDWGGILDHLDSKSISEISQTNQPCVSDYTIVHDNYNYLLPVKTYLPFSSPPPTLNDVLVKRTPVHWVSVQLFIYYVFRMARCQAQKAPHRDHVSTWPDVAAQIISAIQIITLATTCRQPSRSILITMMEMVILC